MKKIAVVLFLGTLTGSAFAQSESQTLGVKARNGNVVMIDMLEEAPEKVSFLALQLPIWHLSGSRINTSLLDLKGSLSYVGKGKVNGEVSYKYGLGDQILPESNERMDYPNNDMVMSIYNPDRAQDFSATGTFFVSEKLKDVEERIRLKTEGKVVTVTDVKTKQLVKTGINIGYSQGFTWYNMNNMELNVASIDNPNDQQVVSFNSMSSMQNYKFIKLGLNITKSVGLKLNAEGYGERESRNISVMNFNVIYALQNEFDDVYVGRYNTDNNEVELMKYTMDGLNTKLPFGFEFTYKEFVKKSAFSYEIGVKYLPGLMSQINLMATFGLSVNIDFFRKK